MHPRTAMSLFIAATLYGVVTFVLVGVVPQDALRGDLKPIHTLAQYIGGDGLGGGDWHYSGWMVLKQ